MILNGKFEKKLIIVKNVQCFEEIQNKISKITRMSHFLNDSSGRIRVNSIQILALPFCDISTQRIR